MSKKDTTKQVTTAWAWFDCEVSRIKANPKNPRIIKDEKYRKLLRSLQDFPQMLQKRPLVCFTDTDGKLVVLGGNMRLKAAQELKMQTLPVILADDWTEEQKNEFLIKDNVGFGEWDWEQLANEWDTQQLMDWGLDIPDFGAEQGKELLKSEAAASLQERFVVPPFSILDTRQGYWQDRKRTWNTLIGDNGESREETLFKSKGNPVSDALRTMKNGVSILDAVLAELVNVWFGLPNCNTFDCFAGDSVFGYVSAHLGNTFTGIELRQEQAQLNNERVKGMPARYICDDGRNVAQHIAAESQDLLFSCPPYFDLEVYSDLPNDASNQDSYEDFMQILDTAFSSAITCLKQNRFAVVTVGDVRDKNGFYYRFVDDVKDIFKRQGMLLYNELILVEAIGGARLRVNGMMKTRKIAKTHQNVLVFFKGNPKEIKNIYPQIQVSLEDGETATDESTDV